MSIQLKKILSKIQDLWLSFFLNEVLHAEASKTFFLTEKVLLTMIVTLISPRILVNVVRYLGSDEVKSILDQNQVMRLELRPNFSGMMIAAVTTCHISCDTCNSKVEISSRALRYILLSITLLSLISFLSFHLTAFSPSPCLLLWGLRWF